MSGALVSLSPSFRYIWSGAGIAGKIRVEGRRKLDLKLEDELDEE